MHNKNNNQQKADGKDKPSFLEGSLKGNGPDTLRKFLKIIETKDINSAEDMRKAMEAAGLKGTVQEGSAEVEVDLSKEEDCDGIGCPVHSRGTTTNADDLKISLLQGMIDRKTNAIEKEIAAQKKPKKVSFFTFKMRERFFLLLLGALAVSHIADISAYLSVGNSAAAFEAFDTVVWIVFAGLIDLVFSMYVQRNKKNIAAFKETGLALTKKIRLSMNGAQEQLAVLKRLNEKALDRLETVIRTERKEKAILQSERDKAVNELATLKEISAKVDAFNKDFLKPKKRKKAAKKTVKKPVTE